MTLLANEYPRGVVVTGHRWSATRNGSFFIRKHLGQLGGSNSIILCPFLLTESNISLGSSVLIRCNALTFWKKKKTFIQLTDRFCFGCVSKLVISPCVKVAALQVTPLVRNISLFSLAATALISGCGCNALFEQNLQHSVRRSIFFVRYASFQKLIISLGIWKSFKNAGLVVLVG